MGPRLRGDDTEIAETTEKSPGRQQDVYFALGSLRRV
jgi:hypothetical protein